MVCLALMFMGRRNDAGRKIRSSNYRQRRCLVGRYRCCRLVCGSSDREEENMIAIADDYIVLGILAPIVLLLFLIK